MTSCTSDRLLLDRIRQRLSALGTNALFTTLPTFADFMWDSDMSWEEAVQNGPAVVIDGENTQRRIVLQCIRGQIRYWCATDRRPERLNADAVDELGWVDSFDDAVNLCHEFLTSSSLPHELLSRRWAHGVLRGSRNHV